ncbi:MAG: RNA polymerase sigma factor [bacterium]|nr:RNA polymerase sigma factor [bacterium]
MELIKDLDQQKELVRKLKNRDDDSFTLLYNSYGKQIYSLALKITGQQEDAEDVMQEALLQIYKSIKTFKEKSHLYTWIYTITRNLCLRFIQKQQKTSFADMEELIHMVQDPDSAKSYTDIEKEYYVTHVKEGCLMGLLRCLSFNQRLAFILHILLHIPVPETSEILGKSESATRTLLHRSRKNMQDFICKNCSLYDKENPCRCENLIDFSLKQGWIQEPSQDSIPHGEHPVLPDIVAEEIDSIKKIALLYNSLPEHTPPESLVHKIKNIIKNDNSAIFSPSKVK